MDEEAGVGAEAQADLRRPLEGLLDERTEWDPEAMSDLSYEPSFVSDRPYESVAQSPATAPFSLVPSLQSADKLTPSAVEMIGHSGASQPASGQGATDLDNMLRVTHASQPPEIPKLVWQEDFWNDLFHPEKSLSSFVPEPVFTRFDLPSQDVFMPAEVTLERPDKRVRNFGPRVFMKVVLNRMVVSWRDQREADLSRALTKWSAVFEAWDNFEVSIVQQLAECSSSEARESLLGDYLARKAPSTCLKRANSIRRLNSRAAENSLSMPLGEPELYKVLCDAKAGGASLSELRGIMEAVTFVRFTFDVDQFSSCAKSRRCWGLSSAKRAQLVTRADPMRVVGILELHRILDQGDDLWDRLMCGAALCCIYCRGRWNDVQHVDNWTLELNDDGHVEFASAVIDIHKTMFFASKAPKVMELIAPGAGVAEGCWVSAFLQVRELLGATYQEGYPTMPAPDKSGLPTVRALSSGEAGAWLRSMLPDREGMRTTSHSLKSTLLSYAAKRGISHLDRLCLGGHTHKDTSIADVYARDALARPLRLLAGMRFAQEHFCLMQAVLLASQAGLMKPGWRRTRLNFGWAPSWRPPTAQPEQRRRGSRFRGLSRLTVTPMTTAASIMSRRPLPQAGTAYFVVLARLWMNIPTWKLKTLLVLILGLGFPHPGRPLLNHLPRTPETTNQTYPG